MARIPPHPLAAVAAAFTMTVVPEAFGAATARAAISEVMAQAKKWHPDAVLTHVSTLTARADGTSRSWPYTVYSLKAKKSAIVTARDLKADLEEVRRNTSTDPLPGEFLDSDKVLEPARIAGLKMGAEGIGLGLTTFGQATANPRVYWAVTLTTEEALSSVTLDARNGAFVKRDDVKLK
ncbi:MAG: hypothetical protein MUF80_11320 [Burkholderiales bacterium]|jgi:hypothetical protein|nr:hypothetical protein [Burkholderiales bacterium]